MRQLASKVFKFFLAARWQSATSRIQFLVAMVATWAMKANFSGCPNENPTCSQNYMNGESPMEMILVQIPYSNDSTLLLPITAARRQM
jgi:hypothetical protein